jgi:hypothetical protein
MWAGYMALVNQQAALEGQGPVGFLNAALYALGNASGAGYAQALHDVAAGSNGYPAVPGFDLATGWGSPNGAGLINALIRSSSPAFTLSNGGPVSVAAGAAGKTALTSAATGGFDSAIALSASGQPNGVTVSFSPASLTGAGSSTVTFQVAATVPAGTYPITLTGATAAAGASIPPSSTTVALTVTVPNYSLSAAAAISIGAGSAGTVSISSAASGGFTSAIALSASGQPAGVALSFSPALINGAGSSTVKLTVAAGAAAGTYPIVLSGTSGAVTKSATVTLTVGAATLSITGAAPALNVLQGAGHDPDRRRQRRTRRTGRAVCERTAAGRHGRPQREFPDSAGFRDAQRRSGGQRGCGKLLDHRRGGERQRHGQERRDAGGRQSEQTRLCLRRGCDRAHRDPRHQRDIHRADGIDGHDRPGRRTGRRRPARRGYAKLQPVDLERGRRVDRHADRVAGRGAGRIDADAIGHGGLSDGIIDGEPYRQLANPAA